MIPLDTKVSAITICMRKKVGNFKDMMQAQVYFFLFQEKEKTMRNAVQECHDPSFRKNGQMVYNSK